MIDGELAKAFGLSEVLAPIKDEHPGTYSMLERRLLLANDRPGMRIADVTMDEIGTASGRFIMKVTGQAWQILHSDALDNMGSTSVGPLQLSASTALNSLFMPGDSLTFAGSTVPADPGQLRLGRLSYDAPLGTNGLRVGFNISHGESWPGGTARLTHTFSQMDTIEGKVSYAALLTQKQSLWINGALGVSQVLERDNTGPIFADRIGIATLSADYKLHATAESWTDVSASYRQGLGSLQPQGSSSTPTSRSGASPYFSIGNATATHLQNIAYGVSLKLTGAGQIASGPQLASQQFSLGGLSYGRGFQSAALTGDSAIAGSGELRFDQSVDLKFAKAYQVYGFVDGGTVVSVAQPGNVVESLASAGAGVRFFLDPELQAGVAVAKPIAYRSATPAKTGTAVLFSVTNTFRICQEKTDRNCRF